MNEKKQPAGGGMFGGREKQRVVDPVKISEVSQGAWGVSRLEDLEKRAEKLEESVAVLTELVQGLVKRIEAMEYDPAEDDSDLDDEDDELDEDEEDESDL